MGLLKQASRAGKALLPVAFFEARDHDSLRAGGMHEEIVNEVDADVGDLAATGMEEYQVSFLAVLPVPEQPGHACLVHRCAQQVHPEHFFIGSLYKSGAIDAMAGVSAVQIGNAIPFIDEA